MTKQLKISALRQRAEAIRGIFSSTDTPIILVRMEHRSYTDMEEITIGLRLIWELLDANKPVEALRCFRATVAHEVEHTVITAPIVEKWALWRNTGVHGEGRIARGAFELRHQISNILEDRRINYCLSSQYSSYALARKTLSSVCMAMAKPDASGRVMFRNGMGMIVLADKVPFWDSFTKKAQKALLEVHKTATVGLSSEDNTSKGLSVENVSDFDVLKNRAERIYEIVLPFFSTKANSILKQKPQPRVKAQGQTQSQQGQPQQGQQGQQQEGQGQPQQGGQQGQQGQQGDGQGQPQQGQSGQGQQQGQGHQSGETGTGESNDADTDGIGDDIGTGDDTYDSNIKDVEDIDKSKYDKVNPPETPADIKEKAEMEYDTRLGEKPENREAEQGIQGIIVIDKIDTERLEKAIEEIGVDVEATDVEIEEIKKLFGIDLTEEERKKLEELRRQAIIQQFGTDNLNVPDSDYDKYLSYKDADVDRAISHLLRIKLEEERLRRKKRTIDAGGLLSPTWVSQRFQRDDKLFVENIPSKHDVAWAVLVDVSGSVYEREVIQAFIALSEIGKTLCGDDRLLLATFDQEYYLVKDLNEKLDNITKGRIGNCYSGGWTNICCSIEKTVRRLAKSTAEKKVIVVVSDGDGNRCDNPNVGYYEHLRLVIAEAKRSGVIVIHLGVDYGEPIPNVPYTEIPSLDELPEKFIELYRKIAWRR